MKIMVVDDEGIVLESCRRVLEPEGFEVTVAVSAMAALESIEKDKPALFLVDIKMPVHDGLFLMNELKHRKLNIPVILMSGLDTAETIAEAQNTGACRFLAKPFTPDELVESVLQVIQKEVYHE